jgi:hypothetical protein
VTEDTSAAALRRRRRNCIPSSASSRRGFLPPWTSFVTPRPAVGRPMTMLSRSAAAVIAAELHQRQEQPPPSHFVDVALCTVLRLLWRLQQQQLLLQRPIPYASHGHRASPRSLLHRSQGSRPACRRRCLGFSCCCSSSAHTNLSRSFARSTLRPWAPFRRSSSGGGGSSFSSKADK